MYSKCGSVSDAHLIFDNSLNPNVVSWTALVLGYAVNGKAVVALDLFAWMKARGCIPNSITYVAALKACTSLASVDRRACLNNGRKIHSEIGSHLNHYIQNTLISMYGKCASMGDARRVFDSMDNPDVVSWNALLLGYAENGEALVSLDLFSAMRSRCTPDSLTYISVLKAYTYLAVNGTDAQKKDVFERAREIHLSIGCHLNQHVQATLIDVYAKCGSMVNSRRVFDTIEKPDVVSWNALLVGYVEAGESLVVLDLLSKMRSRGCDPDSVTYCAALKACTLLAVDGNDKEACLERGRNIHSQLGCHLNLNVQNALIDMYCKLGSVFDAQIVFDSIRSPDVVSWTALLRGYADSGQGRVALNMFSTMKERGCVPDSVTYVAALKACTSLASCDGAERNNYLKRGREIHSDIGKQMDLCVENALIEMYSKFGSMSEARCVFDSNENPDRVSLNGLLLGYAEAGEGLAILDLYSRMKARGCELDSVTYVAALKACSIMATNTKKYKDFFLQQGRKIHLEVGCHLNHYVQNTLIDMYAKLRSMVDARRVFDGMNNPDIVSWTALIMGYAENGNGHLSLELFSTMKSRGYVPDSVAYAAALKACSAMVMSEGDYRKEDILERGRQIHYEIGSHLTQHLQAALVDLYAKCGSMGDARRVFDSIQKPDIVSWNAVLLGYAENGEGQTALDMFCCMTMTTHTCAPNTATYIALLKACGTSGALVLGRKLHLEISEFTGQVVTCLVDFYAKCGSMAEAREVLDVHASVRDVRTWTALLAGYASFGHCDSVFKVFEEMKDANIFPDAVTFLCLLLCCSHAGLVEKATDYFEAMAEYGVTPSVAHYNCMVDVLGRANQLNEAVAIIRRMHCNPNATTWMTLLGAGHKWRNSQIEAGAFQALMEITKVSTTSKIGLIHTDAVN